MEATSFKNNLYRPLSSEENRYKAEKKDFNFQQNALTQKNFISGLRNAKNLLNNLEKSLQKTKKYEKKLAKCRSSHSHSPDTIDWWETDASEEKSKCSKKTGTTKSSTSPISQDPIESWSTMSIVCLQYQYEELAKRYSSLLQAYNERGSSLSTREAALARLRQRVRTVHARLAHAHRTLLLIGEKYLVLRDKRLAQKNEYEKKIRLLKRAVDEVLSAAERARGELNAHISESLCQEKDAATALLLDEIRKCNMLFMENLRLKAQMEMFTA